jgi:hypothetical protein
VLSLVFSICIVHLYLALSNGASEAAWLRLGWTLKEFSTGTIKTEEEKDATQEISNPQDAKMQKIANSSASELWLLWCRLVQVRLLQLWHPSFPNAFQGCPSRRSSPQNLFFTNLSFLLCCDWNSCAANSLPSTSPACRLSLASSLSLFLLISNEASRFRNMISICWSWDPKFSFAFVDCHSLESDNNKIYWQRG